MKRVLQCETNESICKTDKSKWDKGYEYIFMWVIGGGEWNQYYKIIKMTILISMRLFNPYSIKK